MYEDKYSRENRERERGFIQKKPEREGEREMSQTTA